jgi:hemerythrin
MSGVSRFRGSPADLVKQFNDLVAENREITEIVQVGAGTMLVNYLTRHIITEDNQTLKTQDGRPLTWKKDS